MATHIRPLSLLPLQSPPDLVRLSLAESKHLEHASEPLGDGSRGREVGALELKIDVGLSSDLGEGLEGGDSVEIVAECDSEGVLGLLEPET